MGGSLGGRLRRAVVLAPVSCLLAASVAYAQQVPPPPQAPQAPGPRQVPEPPGELEAPVAASPLGSVTVQDGHVVVGAGGPSPRVIDVGCTATAALVRANELTVACGDGLVRTYTASPDGALVRGADRRVGAEVRGLFVQGGRVWVEVARVEAQPVESLAEVQAAAAAVTAGGAPGTSSLGSASESTAAAQVSVARGEVLEVHGIEIVISLGGAQGLRADNRVEIVGAAAEDSLGLVPTIVGRVREVGQERATVEVGFGETVSVGQEVRTTTRPTTGEMLAPARIAPMFAVGGDVRAMVPIGGLGIGALGSLWAEWHAKGPFALRARLMPLGGMYFSAQAYGGCFPPGSCPTGTVQTSGGVFGGSVDAMFDTQYFAVGLGLGVGQYSRGVYYSSGSYGNEVGFGFAVTQMLRIGAIDGLHLVVQNQVLVIDTAFQYGGTDGQIQIPLTHTWWLLIRGGGSVAHYGYTELGMRIATQGDGHAGTLFVTPTVGWAGIDTPDPGGGTYSSLRSGPSVGVGFEVRL